MCMWYFCVKLFLFFEESCKLVLLFILVLGCVFVLQQFCNKCCLVEGVNLCESFVCFILFLQVWCCEGFLFFFFFGCKVVVVLLLVVCLCGFRSFVCCWICCSIPGGRERFCCCWCCCVKLSVVLLQQQQTKKGKKQKQKTHNSGQTQWREREREKQKTKTNKCVVMEN